MKLYERLERTTRGNLLNLADCERSLDTTGLSAKDIFKAKQFGAKFIRDHQVAEITLPYLPVSQYFVDLLKMKKVDYDREPYSFFDDAEPEHHESNFYCHVILMIPVGVDKKSVDRSLFDQFNELSSVTCEIRQAVVTYQPVSVDELGATHSGFAPR